MALTRPILVNTVPFDATKPHVFNFQASGSSTNIIANILTIQRNDTLTTIYSERQETFSYTHNLRANVLTNGIAYQATITTIGADGSQSTPSLPIIFYCLQEPTFNITNLPSGNKIESNSFSFDVLYNQSNGELINNAIFNLYNLSGSLISTSNTLTNFQTVPVTISYLFAGFENNTEYFIEVVGQTVRGMNVSTGRIPIYVSYSGGEVYSAISVINNCKNGYITIQSYIKDIQGVAYPTPPKYIDNSAIDLTGSGNYVEFNNNYEVSGDFIAKLWANKITQDSDILQMGVINGGNLTIRYRVGESNNVFAELRVSHNGVVYTIFSKQIPIPAQTDTIYVMVRRIDNIYDIEIDNRGVAV